MANSLFDVITKVTVYFYALSFFDCLVVIFITNSPFETPCLPASPQIINCKHAAGNVHDPLFAALLRDWREFAATCCKHSDDP